MTNSTDPGPDPAPAATPDLDVPWLAAKRSAITTADDLDAFADDLRTFRAQAGEQAGHSAGIAVVYTLGSVVAGLLIFLVGGFLLEAGQSLMESMNNG